MILFDWTYIKGSISLCIPNNTILIVIVVPKMLILFIFIFLIYFIHYLLSFIIFICNALFNFCFIFFHEKLFIIFQICTCLVVEKDLFFFALNFFLKFYFKAWVIWLFNGIGHFLNPILSPLWFFYLLFLYENRGLSPHHPITTRATG